MANPSFTPAENPEFSTDAQITDPQMLQYVPAEPYRVLSPGTVIEPGDIKIIVGSPSGIWQLVAQEDVDNRAPGRGMVFARVDPPMGYQLVDGRTEWQPAELMWWNASAGRWDECAGLGPEKPAAPWVTVGDALAFFADKGVVTHFSRRLPGAVKQAIDHTEVALPTLTRELFPGEATQRGDLMIYQGLVEWTTIDERIAGETVSEPALSNGFARFARCIPAHYNTWFVDPNAVPGETAKTPMGSSDSPFTSLAQACEIIEASAKQTGVQPFGIIYQVEPRIPLMAYDIQPPKPRHEVIATSDDLLQRAQLWMQANGHQPAEELRVAIGNLQKSDPELSKMLSEAYNRQIAALSAQHVAPLVVQPAARPSDSVMDELVAIEDKRFLDAVNTFIEPTADTENPANQVIGHIDGDKRYEVTRGELDDAKLLVEMGVVNNHALTPADIELLVERLSREMKQLPPEEQRKRMRLLAEHDATIHSMLLTDFPPQKDSDVNTETLHIVKTADGIRPGTPTDHTPADPLGDSVDVGIPDEELPFELTQTYEDAVAAMPKNYRMMHSGEELTEKDLWYGPLTEDDQENMTWQRVPAEQLGRELVKNDRLCYARKLPPADAVNDLHMLMRGALNDTMKVAQEAMQRSREAAVRAASAFEEIAVLRQRIDTLEERSR